MNPAPDRVPTFGRFKWPKVIPPLSPEGKRIADDFMHHWHTVLPEQYGLIERFNHSYPLRHLPNVRPFRTIEIGAGIGGQLALEDLSQQEYHCVEYRPDMAEALKQRFPQAVITIADCQERLPYDDAFFDRAVVVHVLEHLPNLPAAVAELSRVIKPGGILSLVLPCDPGLAYALARKISAERLFKKRYDMPYEWWYKREHINSPAEIFSVVDQPFVEIEREYFPLKIPFVWANICIGVTFRRRNGSDPVRHPSSSL